MHICEFAELMVSINLIKAISVARSYSGNVISRREAVGHVLPGKEAYGLTIEAGLGYLHHF